jgi:hypothetical protein
MLRSDVWMEEKVMEREPNGLKVSEEGKSVP